MYSKNDSIALNHSFYEVINGQNKTDDTKFFMLQQRCLFPGLYAEALERWLQYYRPGKVFYGLFVFVSFFSKKVDNIVMATLMKLVSLPSHTY